MSEATEWSDAPAMSREEMFDKHYFNGGGKVGGYAREGYWDYPTHEITFRHVMARKPESVLEIGCARGYILKRLRDAGVRIYGMEISKHCVMTRAVNPVYQVDVCSGLPWAIGPGPHVDLCFSIAVLEHVPEEHLPHVIGQMRVNCKRGLHGIDFGGHDDGFDKTHCTLRPRDWWLAKFAEHAPGWPVEVLDKEELERGEFPQEVLRGDGKLKLNVGSFTQMHHRGWTNIDAVNLAPFAQHWGFHYMHRDVRQGLPFKTGEVDLIYSSHFLEHLTYDEGLAFLRECRRVVKPGGAMRIIVPDAAELISSYVRGTQEDSADLNDLRGGRSPLSEFSEINDGLENLPTDAVKLHALLMTGHSAIYDAETLLDALRRSGWDGHASSFASISPGEGFAQIARETVDTFPCLSLYVNAVPAKG